MSSGLRPPPAFDSRLVHGDEGPPEDDPNDEEPDWEPSRGETATLGDSWRVLAPILVVFGASLFGVGLVGELAAPLPSLVRWAILAVVLLPCLFILVLGSDSGELPIFYIGVALLIGLIVVVVFSAEVLLWVGILLQVAGAATLGVGLFLLVTRSSSDKDDA